MICRFISLYPGSMTKNTRSKWNLLWRFNSWNNFAINMESFPPEIQIAILSFSCTRSYVLIAFTNLENICLWNFLRILFSISCVLVSSFFLPFPSASLLFCSVFWSFSCSSFIKDNNHPVYPPSKLRTSIPSSANFSAASLLKIPLVQYKITFLPWSIYSFACVPSSSSPAATTAPGIIP